MTIRFVDDRGLEQLARVELCPACARELGLFLHPGSVPARTAETEADDDLVADSDAAPLEDSR